MPYVSYPEREFQRAVDRFWSKVNKHGPKPRHLKGRCWIWTSYTNKDGYGQTSSPAFGTSLVHRIAWLLAERDLDPTLVLDHLCRNRACCNPDHLEQVTFIENYRRGGVGEHNRSKKSCPQGHPYSGANLRVRQGRRHCATCEREQDAARKRKRRQDAAGNWSV